MKLADLLPEKEIREAVLSEYEKRLTLFKITDEKFRKKYNMRFQEFEKKNLVAEKGFSWDIEQDSMNWELAVENIRADLDGRPAWFKATWNAICLADMGDTGVAFVAMPQMPPRNLCWMKQGRWVHWMKVAFEKYFLHKMKTGNPEPLYEKFILRLLGLRRLDKAA